MGQPADDERQYISLLAQGQSAAAKQMTADGYTPSMAALCGGLAGAALRADSDGIEQASTWSVQNGKTGQRSYWQMYSDSLWSERHKSYVLHGNSAWLALMKSGKGPGHPGFDSCATQLAAMASLDAPLFIDCRDASAADQSERLIHHLAARGWLDLAQTLDAGGSRMDPSGRRSAPQPGESGKPTPLRLALISTPLRLALISGHGSFAQWLLGKGAKPSVDMFNAAARGLHDPLTLSEGLSAPASESDRLLALRIGAKLDGLAVVDSSAMKKFMDDPLANPLSLAAWLMMKGARAQAKSTLSLDRRVEEVAKILAEADNVPWEKALADKPSGEVELVPVPQPKSAFSLFSKRKAEKLTGQEPSFAKYWDQAKASVKARAGADLGGMLGDLEAGRFAKAREALSQMEGPALIEASVALLGLAKHGYWDMPLPGGVDEGRNAPRWAGFKLASKELAAKGLIDEPIEGLHGIGLMGLASALGHADACAALIDAGAKPDPDDISEAASPLAVSLKFGRFDIAQSLLAAGASPLEGAKPSAFGFARKPWALHIAIDAKLLDLAEAMLAADPRCSALPDPSGKNAYERALAGCQDDPDSEFHARLMAAAERAGMMALSYGEPKAEPATSSEKDSEQGQPSAPNRARPQIAAHRPKSL